MKNYTVIFTLLLFLFISCNDDDIESCPEIKDVPITHADGPLELLVPNEHRFSTKYPVSNGCVDFYEFTEVREGQEVYISASILEDKCASCVYEIDTCFFKSYIFETEEDFLEPYHLYFESTNDESIEKVIYPGYWGAEECEEEVTVAAVIPNGAFNAITELKVVYLNDNCLYLKSEVKGCVTNDYLLISTNDLIETLPAKKFAKPHLLIDNDCGDQLSIVENWFDLSTLQEDGINEILLEIEGWDQPIIYNY